MNSRERVRTALDFKEPDRVPVDNNGNVYVPIKLLGVGAYASVWVCYCKNKKKLMAIKIFHDNEMKSGKTS